MKNQKTTEKPKTVRKMNEELKDLVGLFNEYANELNELMNKDIKKPFEINPLLTLRVRFNAPYVLNEYASKYIFNSVGVSIVGVRIENSVMVFEIMDSEGNSSNEKIYLGNRAESIKLWEYYLIAMISNVLPIYIEEKRTDLALFVEDLKALLNNVE